MFDPSLANVIEKDVKFSHGYVRLNILCLTLCRTSFSLLRLNEPNLPQPLSEYSCESKLPPERI